MELRPPRDVHKVKLRSSGLTPKYFVNRQFTWTSNAPVVERGTSDRRYVLGWLGPSATIRCDAAFSAAGELGGPGG